MFKKIITFDEGLREHVLGIFGKKTNQKGIVVEGENPAQPVLTPDGQPLKLEDFAGIRKGSQIFVKSDIGSLIQFLDASKLSK